VLPATRRQKQEAFANPPLGSGLCTVLPSEDTRLSRLQTQRGYYTSTTRAFNRRRPSPRPSSTESDIVCGKQGTGLPSQAVPSAEEAEELKAKAGGIRTWIVLEVAAQTVLLISAQSTRQPRHPPSLTPRDRCLDSAPTTPSQLRPTDRRPVLPHTTPHPLFHPACKPPVRFTLSILSLSPSLVLDTPSRQRGRAIALFP
jgi:hypothetical protein